MPESSIISAYIPPEDDDITHVLLAGGCDTLSNLGFETRLPL